MTVTCKSFYLSKVYVHNLFTFDNTSVWVQNYQIPQSNMKFWVNDKPQVNIL